VRQCIEIELDKLPPAYALEVYQQKCDLAYQHVYDAYFGEGCSIYARAA
jgi:type I restriction enzyme R subunit